MDKRTLANMMDHTLLKATATPEQIDALCDEAVRLSTASVCVNPCYVSRCAKRLMGTGVLTCTVVGFPLGANATAVKAFETADAVEKGADEIDMVINIGMLKAGNRDYVEQDIRAVVEAAKGKTVKVIIETCYLTDEEKVAACEAASRAGAQFVKTSTGFGTAGAKAQDVALMKQSIPAGMKVKAAGGMRSYGDVLPVLEAGADRLGVSASVAILAELEE